jgi:general L-amino acid transport system substrate-binding protein
MVLFFKARPGTLGWIMIYGFPPSRACRLRDGSSFSWINDKLTKRRRKQMKLLKLWLLVMAVVVALSGVAFAGPTLDNVKAKGFVQVGVNGELFGFGKPDEKGVWRGLDVDTGRAIAAAVFGDADKIKFIPLTSVQRFTGLQSGEVDVLCRNATQTLGRDTELGLDFAQVNYYDGQGFLVPKKNKKIKRAKDLNGATVCVLPGTTTELNVADYFRENKMKMKPVVIESNAELAKAFLPEDVTS